MPNTPLTDTGAARRRQTGARPALPEFPAGFVFGVSTASYQIEGAAHEDGRGTSIWDTFSHTPGKVAGGDTGDVACDHYHRWREDVRLMAGLGVDAYRFSVAWPRIQPDGRGPVNERGLDFYRRLVDAVLDAGIRPCLTLYHWDLPQALEDAGGWRVRDTAERFAEYAQLVFGALGDRVPLWITLNEPYCSSIVGYAEGRHAPGAREGEPALAAAHHLLVGHGMAVEALRAAGARARGARIGITLNPSPAHPATSAPEDVAAAERAELLNMHLFTEPVLGGRYPERAREVWSQITDFSFVRDGDLALTSAPLDFLGINYYFREHVRHGPYVEADPALRAANDIAAYKVRPAGVTDFTEMGWPVEPDGLTELLTGLRDRFPDLPPLYITENGRACPDVPDADGTVDDGQRIAYLADHLAAVRAAMDAGVDVHGYFVWSLLDNFEWAEGYAKRFGLVYVDYPTGRRTPKATYHWLAEGLAARRGDGAR